MAALAFQNSKQVVDMVVLWGKIACPVKSLRRGVVVSLPQREYSPVGPSRRLAWDQLCHLGELAFSVNVIAHLQRRETDVEDRNNIRIDLGIFVRQLGCRTASRDRDQGGQGKRQKGRLNTTDGSPSMPIRTRSPSTRRIDPRGAGYRQDSLLLINTQPAASSCGYVCASFLETTKTRPQETVKGTTEDPIVQSPEAWLPLLTESRRCPERLAGPGGRARIHPGRTG